MATTKQFPALLAASLVLVGCGITDTANDNLNFDAAVVAADGTLEDLEVMHGPRLGMRGIVFPELVGGRPDCPRTQDIFLCDPIEREGLTYSRTIIYRDPAGNSQDAYDEATTASIEYEIAVEGSRGRTGWSANISRTRNLVVTGLLDGAGVVTWNGNGTGNIERSRLFADGTERGHDATSMSSIKDVVIPFPREDDSWPLSGTVTRNVTLVRTNGEGTENVEKTATVAFNGTSLVPVTVNGETFELDLTQRMGRGRHVRKFGNGS